MDCRTSSLSLVTVSMACLLSVGLHKPDSWNFSTEKELKAMCKSAASSPSLHFNEKINSEIKLKLKCPYILLHPKIDFKNLEHN